MKRFLIYSLLMIACLGKMWGARAYPHPKTITQPDGTQLTIMGHGDEFSHCITTTDGYTILKSEDGWYRYATLNKGKIKPSQIIANDEHNRTAFETSFLKSTPHLLRVPISATGEKLLRLSDRNEKVELTVIGNNKGRKPQITRSSDNKTYRGLVILVDFSDRTFSRGENAAKLVDQMMNMENHSGYFDPVLKTDIHCTGSVRDYFRDNSDGKFIPEFDIVGPIRIDESQYYINGIERTYELCKKVMETADGQIDFSKYDWDDDGEIDMVYILYAGYSSIYQGNDERLVWSHAGHMADSDLSVTLDGKKLGRFACSSEIFGWHDEGDLFLDGIGVIVHEFSHVLGFKDHYDVSGYLNEDPGIWDVMASGNYNGVLNDTPCGYNSYERYSAGFMTSITLTAEDEEAEVRLPDLTTSGKAFRFASMQDSTVFMLENRQLIKWDYYLPGHGMLIWRVDSCDSHMWRHNALNVNNRLHFKLVRANGASFNLFNEIDDNDGDPFPGSRNINAISNFSPESNLLTDHNYPSPITLSDIRESKGVISFKVGVDGYANPAPYIFGLNKQYSASGILIDDNTETPIKWEISTGTVPVGTVEKKVMYNFIPDTEGIGGQSSNSTGFSTSYAIGSDKLSVIIEPTRVTLKDQEGVWLVNFSDLDNGGSGAITLELDPYGNISITDPETVIGYCTLPKNCVTVDPFKIIRRFSLIKNISFETLSSISEIQQELSSSGLNNIIYNLQGMPVSNTAKGEIYILGGKKIKW